MAEAFNNLETIVNDQCMSNYILDQLECDIHLTNFLFFQPTQNMLSHHSSIAEVLSFATSLLFKMKYGKRKKSHKPRETFKYKL